MAFKINGSDIIGAGRQFTSTANVSVTDSIIIADNESLGAVSGSAAGYTFSDGTVAIGEDGLGLNDVTLQDALIEVTGPPGFQGTVSGYASGGTPGPGAINIIDKFPFSIDSNATDVGDLTQGSYRQAGQSSSESGYISGGFPGSNVINKFPFSTDSNATDVGDLTQGRREVSGQSSKVSGYTSGGQGTPVVGNIIDKFPFAADTNATDVGDLTQARTGPVGQSSIESGYSSGGRSELNPASVFFTTIDKFPFAADANATDVGDLTVGRYVPAGQNSTEHGYTSGGAGMTANVNTIDKFPFVADANATDVGDLTQIRFFTAGQSSTESGYTSAGLTPSDSNTIDKFPFAADTSATDVGDLTRARSQVAGQQV